MSYSIQVEDGLRAHFKQPSGPSRPGVDWKIRVDGEKSVLMFVKTYFSSNPQETSEDLAAQAIRFVKSKLDQGWIPVPGFFEVPDDFVS